MQSSSWGALALGAGLYLSTYPFGDEHVAVAVAEPNASPGSSIIVAGQPFEVGRPVVLWNDPQGFDAYQVRCIDQRGGCCDTESKRFGARKEIVQSDPGRGAKGSLAVRVALRRLREFALVLQVDAQPPPPGGRNGCGLSAHFMIDADGTIYQTLDLVERAFHAEEANSGSVGVEICNRGRVDRGGVAQAAAGLPHPPDARRW